ncbi:hypothetical protein [Sphingorhabdus contaminans]|uniref:hypothetical protein n=1 Tax=Sphingorhabdus contaminans TaxID=1343899 RepID=UPI003D2DF842
MILRIAILSSAILLGFGLNSELKARESANGQIVDISVKNDEGAYFSIKAPSKADTGFAKILDSLSKCVASKTKINIAELFRTEGTGVPLTFENITENIGKEDFGKCLPPHATETNANMELYIGRFAQALYLRDFPSLPEISLRDLRVSRAYPEHPVFVAMLNIADCVTMKNPSEVDRLLRTKSGSFDEFLALREMEPHFMSCLPPQGGVETGSVMIRGTFAFSIYARANGLTKQ